MMPVEDGKISSKTQPNWSATAMQDLAAGVDAGLAGGAVGVAGVDEDGGDAAAGGGEVAAADGDGRGDNLVRVNMAAALAPPWQTARASGLAAGLDAGGNGGPAEAEREGGGGDGVSHDFSS